MIMKIYCTSVEAAHSLGMPLGSLWKIQLINGETYLGLVYCIDTNRYAVRTTTGQTFFTTDEVVSVVFVETPGEPTYHSLDRKIYL